MELLIFTITLFTFVIPIINSIYNPHDFQLEALIDARSREQSDLIITITRTFQYLTLYTQFFTLIALYTYAPNHMFIAQFLTIYVFIVYHGINYICPFYLTYHNEKIVNEVISWIPPYNENIILWFGLHLQHTIGPFYIYYLSYKYDITYENNIVGFFYTFLALLFYILWNLFCWNVQGKATYPFLNDLREFSLETAFYSLMFVLFLFIGCIMTSMYSSFVFFCIGVLYTKCNYIYDINVTNLVNQLTTN